MPPSTERRTLLIAIVLNISVWASITLSRTYIDILFLSTYSIDFLPYFFIGQTVVILSLTLAIAPLASQGKAGINALIFLLAAISVVIAYILLDYNISGFAFVFSLWLSAIPVVLLVISLNSIVDAFDVRRFKKVVVWVNVAGYTGGLFTGLLIPTIIASSGTEVLLLLLALFSIIASACFFYLPAVPSPHRRHAKGQSAFNYPLFRYIAICTFLLMIVDTLADYVLKVELSNAFSDKEDIGSFVGPFYGIANVIMMALQLVGTQHLLKFFGVAGLLSIVPIFCGLSSLSLMIMPSLWTAAFIRMGENVFRFSYFSTGREIALKPLPAQIRRASKFLITAAGYLGAGLGAIALWAIVDVFGMLGVGILMLITSIIWLFFTQKITQSYKDTLEEAIRIKRFSSYEYSLQDPGLGSQRNDLKESISKAFGEKDVDTIRFGFTLLAKSESTCIPKIAYQHLDSDAFDVRVDFIRAAYRLHDTAVIDLLLHRLEVEDDGKAILWILKTLENLDPASIVDKAPQWLDSPLALARAGAIVVSLDHGSLDDIIKAAATLKKMVYSSDAIMRRGAAYAISGLRTGSVQKELLILLQDSVEVVSIAAMWAVADQNNHRLIPALVTKLGRGRVSHYASRTLIQLGEPVLPHIIKIIQAENSPATRPVVRILSAIHNEAADKIIMGVVNKGDVMIRTLFAKSCALRAKHHSNSDFIVGEARQSVALEASIVLKIKQILSADGLPHHVRLELMQRKYMAESRLLYWFDVATKSVDLSGIIPVMLGSNHNQAKYATALEFLESQTRDKVLRKAIAVFEQTPKRISTEEALHELKTLQDKWLNWILDIQPRKGQVYVSGKNMEITEKVMLLRKVKLFANLPGEILLTIAETCEDRELIKDEKLFVTGDPPDGMYVVASGVIGIVKDNELVAELDEYHFFGELGLFDDSPRMADAIAQTDGMVLFLQKEVFDGITEDLPEVLRALVRTVIGYLK